MVFVSNRGGKIMPPSPYNRLPDEQITAIALWIEQGAKNTAGCGNNITSDTASVTFSASVRPILQTHCTVCHSANPPQGGIDLSNHAGVKAMATGGTLLGAINHVPGFKPMPYPAGSPKMPQCQIDQVRIWIQGGALNN